MLAFIKRFISQKYFNTVPMTEGDYKKSQRMIIAATPTASIINLLISGSFLVGYLTHLGASSQYSAIMGAIPQLGCLLQLFSPYLFERLKHRKLLICISCFLFRFLVGTIIIVPYLVSKEGSRLAVIMIIYTTAFMIAGFVTPGLSSWYLDIAPESGRGRFLAIKDIISMSATSLVSMLIGKMLDYYGMLHKPMVGFTIMFSFVILLSFVDFLLISNIDEPKEKNHVVQLSLFDLILTPLKDKVFRRFILFLSVWNFAVQFSVSIIPIFMLNYIGLSYSYISAVTVAGNVFGMISIYLWGRLADKTSWRFLIRICGFLIACCYFGWFLVNLSNAKWLVVLLQVMMVCCNGAFHMASNNIQYNAASDEGKTAYLGVTQAIACVISFIGAVLGSKLLKVFEGMDLQISIIGADAIQFLFLITSVLLIDALFLLKRK